MSEKRRDSKGRLLKDNESQRKDGRYQFRYTDSCGERKIVYSWRLVESDPHPQGKKRDISLREKEVQIQKDTIDGIDTGKQNITVNNLFDKYMSIKNNISHVTRKNREILYDGNVRNSALGLYKIADVTKSDVLKLYKQLSQRGLCNGTIQHIHTILKCMFQMAVDDDIIRKNPCVGCNRDFPYSSYGKRDALTTRQQQILLEFMERDKVYSKHLLITKVILGTGLRCGEVIGLTGDEIDWKKKAINVRHQLQYVMKGEHYRFSVEKPKTERGVRTIPLKDDVYKLLYEWKQATYFQSINSKVEIDGQIGFVFLNRNNDGVIVPKRYTDSLNRAVSKYNKLEMKASEKEERKPELLPTITAHTLRHTYCTRMAEAGMDVKVLQKIMGHSKLETTMEVYNHADEERIMNEFKRVENTLLLA